MVPALNEELSIRDTIHRIVRSAERNDNFELDIIIVDDGSIDKTPDIINDLVKKFSFVRAIHHKKNMGMGRSLAEVIKIANYDNFLIIPGDNDISEVHISTLFKNMHKAEMVMTYFINKEKRGRFRNIISLLYGTIYMIFFNIHVQYISGPCIYPTKKVRGLKLISKRFSIVSEITTKLLLLGCTYHEIPAYMQKGEEGSTAISIKNLLDVCKTFTMLLIEIKITNRKLFCQNPSRIY